MELSLPIALALGLVVIMLVRKSELKILHALAAIMLGFFLASSAFAGQISQIDGMIAGLFGGSLHP